MKVSDSSKNKQKQHTRTPLKPVAPVTAPIHHRQSSGHTFKSRQSQQNQIISGYFVHDKSYKERVISRLNTSLCMMLAFLVAVCIVSYYFVTTGEIALNKIRKETLALNYDNDEMQNKLDNLQSYYNVDKTVSKTNILGRAKQVMEIAAAAEVPSVKYQNKTRSYNPSWSMGY